MIFKRNYYLDKLIDGIDNKQVKIITGIRRCGKSFLLFNLFNDYLINQLDIKQDHIIKIELDRRTMFNLHNPDQLCKYVYDQIKDKDKYFIFIDEIQLCKEFESVLIEFLHIKNVDIYVTGSNSKMLSKDIITNFRDRGYQIHLNPLSFREFYNAGDFKDFNKAWKEYVNFGGMPYILYKDNDHDKMNYLKELLTETYIKDIKERNNIRNDKVLLDVINVLASSVGSFTNCLNLTNTIQSVSKTKVSINTVKQYLAYLEDAFIISKANKYDVKGRKYLSCPFKYYFSDVGLRNALLNFRQTEQTHLMENIVFNELINRGYLVDTGVVIINQKNNKQTYDRKQLECDFVVNNTNQRVYIQCAYTIQDPNKYKKEVKSLNSIKDSFKKMIITNDDIKKTIDPNGIVIISLKDFLMGERITELESNEQYNWLNVVKVAKKY